MCTVGVVLAVPTGPGNIGTKMILLCPLIMYPSCDKADDRGVSNALTTDDQLIPEQGKYKEA